MAQALRKTIEVGAVYDLETEGWGQFLVGGHYDGETYTERDHERESDFAGAIVSSGDPLWAHNGGIFDHKWLLGRLRDSGSKASVRVAGSRIVELRTNSFRAYDSKALAKISLAAFSKGLGVSKLGNPLACNTQEVCGPWCSGYCRFRRGMERGEWNQVREYLRADCVSLWQSLERLKEWGETHDLDLAPTIGSASFANASRHLGLGDGALPPRDHEFARRAYYGGRVQVFRPEAAFGYEYDVNAMYPAALSALELPTGVPGMWWGLEADRRYRAGFEGIFAAHVDVPDMWIPPLPVRAQGRSAYPTGHFAGVWTGLDLRYAESVGVSVRVTQSLCWPERRNVFADWIAKLWDLRKNAEGGKSGPFGTFLKFYMNSLSGKLGTDPKTDGFVVNPENVTPRMEEVGDGIFKYSRSGLRKRSDGTWVAGSPCSLPHWAAYVTSWGRREWHRQATAGRDRDLVYGDTDSIFSLLPRSQRVGDALGHWQDKGTFRDFRAFAPKFYRYRPNQAGEPVIRVRSKGVRARHPSDWDRLWEDGSFRFAWDANQGFRSAARTGPLFHSVEMARRVVRGYGDRLLEADGTTRPPTAVELGIDGTGPRAREGNAPSAFGAQAGLASCFGKIEGSALVAAW